MELIKKENFKLNQSLEYMNRLIKTQKHKIDLLNSESVFEDKFRSVLSKMFTPSQITVILKNPKKVHKWSNDDISYALTLRSISPKAYRFLRKSLEFPLPGL